MIPNATNINPMIVNNAIVRPTDGTGLHFLKNNQCKNPFESLIINLLYMYESRNNSLPRLNKYLVIDITNDK